MAPRRTIQKKEGKGKTRRLQDKTATTTDSTKPEQIAPSRPTAPRAGHATSLTTKRVNASEQWSRRDFPPTTLEFHSLGGRVVRLPFIVIAGLAMKSKAYTVSSSSESELKKPVKSSPLRWIKNRLDQFIAPTDPSIFSQKWQEDFSRRPSWCDAGLALQQVRAGVAKGSRVALYARAIMQRCLFYHGTFIQRHAIVVFIVMGLFCSTCLVLPFFTGQYKVQADFVKLWVEEGGRLQREIDFPAMIRRDYDTLVASIPEHEHSRSKREATPKTAPKGISSAFQVLIQTTANGDNILTQEGLLKHVDIMNEVAKLQIQAYNETWSLADICFKPPIGALPKDPILAAVSGLLEKVMPCLWITPIDCFWEGSKPLGPHPPLLLPPEINAFLSSLPKGHMSWSNLNPSAVLDEASQFVDLTDIKNIFKRAKVGVGYLDRPCIDPLDPMCPVNISNGWEPCNAVHKFIKWNNALPEGQRFVLEEELPKNASEDSSLNLGDIFGFRLKRQASLNATANNTDLISAVMNDKLLHKVSTTTALPAYDDDTAYYDDADNSTDTEETTTEAPVDMICEKYKNALRKWMREHPKLWNEFLTNEEQPKYPDYGKVMTGGCTGFARFLTWPEDMIIGAPKRRNDKIVSAEGFQSVLLMADAKTIYDRYQGNESGSKPHLNRALWSQDMARNIAADWQRAYISLIFDHPINTKPVDVPRTLHPFAITQLSDMLEEFSEFNFVMVFFGYGIMVVYAAFGLARWDGWWLAVDSCSGLAIFGTLLVTFATFSGLGFCVLLGIENNVATTQVVPFLTLGLGVDDMFLLVHSYQEIMTIADRKQIGFLLMETGLSASLTSINNVLAFMAGSLLPLPAIKSFCRQTAVALIFNAMVMFTMFVAMLSFDMIRRKAGRRDLLFFKGTIPKVVAAERDVVVTQQKSVNTAEDKNPKHGHSRSTISLDNFVAKVYIPLLKTWPMKIFILLIGGIMICGGIAGLSNTVTGLELSDVVPKGTPSSAFLMAREKYFSFYQMYLVLEGPFIDYPRQQAQIEQFRRDIAKSKYVIKDSKNKPTEPFWLDLLRDWLASYQEEFDKAVKNGTVNMATGQFTNASNKEEISKEVFVARRLICSYGDKYDCAGRIGRVRLVHPNNTINEDNFYNSLTAWKNVDAIMGFVSEAAFFPSPPDWVFKKNDDTVIPPARVLGSSQMRFYLRHLVDTPAILDAVSEIRTICEEYTSKGMAVHPTGEVFIFWEPYFALSQSLTIALVVISCAVFVTISILLVNPWTGLMVTLVVVTTVTELAGCMGWTGLKFNPVSATSVVSSIGIAVEFAVHVSVSFLTCLGTRAGRMDTTMNHMFAPVVHGGFSNLLGQIMLAFNGFEFIVKYVFWTLTALALIGIFNGLVLLPVILSIAGPPCEVVPVDGSNRLEVPKIKRSEAAAEGGSGMALRVRSNGSFDTPREHNREEMA
uniref:SSD domain-containing protein n=1 Tax=Plectus sambesii TaxID=2011161 RepID=A0A914UMC9_9BILA